MQKLQFHFQQQYFSDGAFFNTFHAFLVCCFTSLYFISGNAITTLVMRISYVGVGDMVACQQMVHGQPGQHHACLVHGAPSYVMKQGSSFRQCNGEQMNNIHVPLMCHYAAPAAPSTAHGLSTSLPLTRQHGRQMSGWVHTHRPHVAFADIDHLAAGVGSLPWLHGLVLLILAIVGCIHRRSVESLALIHWLCEVDGAGIIGVDEPAGMPVTAWSVQGCSTGCEQHAPYVCNRTLHHRHPGKS